MKKSPAKKPRARRVRAVAKTKGNRLPSSFGKISGNDDHMFGALLLHGATSAISSTSQTGDIPQEMLIELATSALAGIEPNSGVEALLAGQMLQTHMMATELGRRALGTQDRQQLALYGNLTDRLLRTFTRQVETLSRLRGQSSRQTVRVEHVHVEAGGQAIVGAVEQKGGGGRDPK